MNMREEVGCYGAYFAKQSDGSHGKILPLAFDEMKSRGYKVKWMEESQCFRLKNYAQQKIVVVEEFEGPAFEHLQREHVRVLGPVFIIQYLYDKKPFLARPWPLFSASMHGFTVSCCNKLPLELRRDIRRKVEYMGGFYRKTGNATVTHLIAGDDCFEEHAGHTVMTPEWIQHLWSYAQYKFQYGNDISEKYLHRNGKRKTHIDEEEPKKKKLRAK